MTSMNVFMFPPSVLSLFLCVCGEEGEGGGGEIVTFGKEVLRDWLI